MDKIQVVEQFSEKCALWRYKCPVDSIEDLQQEGSKYSPEFDVGQVSWRLHLQQRVAPQTNDVYLAVHLQCCSPLGAYGHFKVSIANRDPNLSKAKTFHCHFKKAGSAWGLHHFIALERLLNPDAGFIDEGNEGAPPARGYRAAGGARQVVIDVLINVLDPGADGAYSIGTLPQVSRPSGFASFQPQQLPPHLQQRNYNDCGQSSNYVTNTNNNPRSQSRGNVQVQQPPPLYQDPLAFQAQKAPLVYPFEHLESLCDMWFDVQGIKIKAHRCVVGARMLPLIPPSQLPLAEGTTVQMSVPMDVFAAFLRYVYTEDYPESGVLRAESLLDLYLLAAQCEFFDLSGVCLKFVRPMLTHENILPIVLTRYNAADDILTAMYLRVLLDNYDSLIQERQFEEIPGHLFRRLSLILRDKEKLPPVNIPASKNTLAKQLGQLAESGDYADYEMVIGDGQLLPAHKYIIASRSVIFSQAFHRKQPGPVPSFQSLEFNFSLRAWQKFLSSMYRRHIEPHKDFSAEDITMIFKMNQVLTLDGQLKKEAELSVSQQNALRVLIYAVKHNCTELRDRAIGFVSVNFQAMVRGDPQAWDLISELPQPAVVTLFRTVTEVAAGQR